MPHPLLARGPYVTDGGLETDLIFHHGFDLPEFASFPLVEDDAGREALHRYYAGYAEVARRLGRPLLLETPTWRANPDWAALLGYDAGALDRVNRAAVDLVASLRDQWPDLDVVLVGVLGPRGDGYVAGEAPEPDEAADYHAAQVASLAAAGAELVTAYTLTTPNEAIGIVRAARAADVPVCVSFTVETDGRLPDGTPLAEAVRTVDAHDAPDWFGVNCAHPVHVAPALDGGAWQERIALLRPNSSTLTHAELDVMEVLDEGDLPLLTATFDDLRPQLPSLGIVGGCCGTDARHVAALWGV